MTFLPTNSAIHNIIDRNLRGRHAPVVTGLAKMADKNRLFRPIFRREALIRQEGG